MKESLIGELMDMQVFWSYKKQDLYDLSDESMHSTNLLFAFLLFGIKNPQGFIKPKF